MQAGTQHGSMNRGGGGEGDGHSSHTCRQVHTHNMEDGLPSCYPENVPSQPEPWPRHPQSQMLQSQILWRTNVLHHMKLQKPITIVSASIPRPLCGGIGHNYGVCNFAKLAKILHHGLCMWREPQHLIT